MTKEKHNCDNVNCNHNDTKGLCCLFNPDNCKYRQLQKENAKLNDELEKLKKQLEELPDKWCRNKDDYCPHLATLEQENAELRKTETMLKILKDRGVIKSWYYNGSYHVGNELPR